MKRTQSHAGYAFLVTVLVMGAIAASAVATLLLLNTSVLRNTITLESSFRAQSAAMSCAEHALSLLRSNLGYAGNETLTLTNGALCDILPLEGGGNADRSVCVQATDNGVIRRMEISIESVLPQTTISRWREVTDFSLCDS